MGFDQYAFKRTNNTESLDVDEYLKHILTKYSDRTFLKSVEERNASPRMK